MQKKIGLIGYFGYATKNPIIGGQMSKTRGIYAELEKKYGKDRIVVIDTSNWKYEVFRLLFSCFQMLKCCDPIIVMPNKNGIKFVLPFFAFFKKICKYRLAYPVVGGWVTGLLEKHKILRNSIKKIDFILPETKELSNELQKFTDSDIKVMPIFSTRKIVEESSIPQSYDSPFSFCTFSRVTPEKGVDYAIKAIVKANERIGKSMCKLDVWGPIDVDYREHYMKLFDVNSDCVNYKGILSSEEGLDRLASYYMMIFPTFYPGEGFPTTVCESFMAALPVIASDWRFNGELIENEKNGFLVPVHDIDSLTDRIVWSISNQEEIKAMKRDALIKSRDYLPENVIADLISWIENII